MSAKRGFRWTCTIDRQSITSQHISRVQKISLRAAVYLHLYQRLGHCQAPIDLPSIAESFSKGGPSCHGTLVINL